MKEKMTEAKITLIDRKLVSMGVTQKGSEVRCSFLLSQIECFREFIDDDQEEVSQNEVTVYFKSGSSIVINMSYGKLSKLYNEYINS